MYHPRRRRQDPGRPGNGIARQGEDQIGEQINWRGQNGRDLQNRNDRPDRHRDRNNQNANRNDERRDRARGENDQYANRNNRRDRDGQNANLNDRRERGRGGNHQNANRNDREPRFHRGADPHDNDDQQPRNNQRTRPQRTMGFQYVERLLNKDIQQVVMDLSNDRNGFARLLDSSDISNDMVVLLVKLFAKVCTISFQGVKVALLTGALDSRFMEKITMFITGIMTQTDREKRSNRHFWNDPDQFWNSLLKISKTIQELIPTYCQMIAKTLNTMDVFFPGIENRQSIHISDGIKEQTSKLLAAVEKTILDLEVKKLHVQYNRFDEDAEPPDDFRQIEIIPSAQEVVSRNSPFLRPNIIDRAFKSVDQYLDIQFRLLREDFVAPLRRGINTYLENQAKQERKKLDDIKVYNPIKFLSVETLNECTCFKMRFDFGKQKRTFKNENSKRFMFGSLVCFTNDNFQTLLFGKIVDRDIKLLEQGLLIVGFHSEVQVNFETDYLMVESTVYFEPYYQVLGVLKRIDAESFPMQKYIINVETDSQCPEYLRNKLVHYEVEGDRFMPLAFPHRRFHNFNDSQHDAFKAALTDEFCIIQGPPGTGKTYVGLKIAHTLLENRHAWYNNTPILVICFTNHALDQFLEGLLPVTENILRVGGQSKNENLKKYNLAQKRRGVNKQGAVLQKRWEVQTCMRQQKSMNDTLSQIDSNECVVQFSCFSGSVENFENSWFANAKRDDIVKWLLEGKSRDGFAVRERNNQRQVQARIDNLNLEDELDDDLLDDTEEDERNTTWLDDILEGIVIRPFKAMLSLSDFRDRLTTLRAELEKLRNEPADELDIILREEKIQREIWEIETNLDYLVTQLELYQNPRNRRRPRRINLQNPFEMDYDDRWRLYYHWLDQYTIQLRRSYAESGLKFKEVYRVYNEMRDIEDTQLMMQHLVVGMTTTGAARLQSTLQALRSPIVIVEEAAEVLEAHIVAALTNHCKHLILIGDHLQLKPGAADYRIETTYKLGISLFERMVKNDIKCHTLNVQHRMRPEISKLIKPHIYPDLKDHETTLQRAPILGVVKCLYFIDHREPENACQDSSKKNTHESKFLVALARHLILNGYKPEKITILAAYLGQFFEMRNEVRKPNNKLLLQDVRISVLDNYQGEESDIILLSLVRSNEENKAGFLRIQNRVCVALSRARDGFFIMGNMPLLLNSKSENQIWEKVKAVLDDQNAIGPQLTLQCQVHRFKYTQVSRCEDFRKMNEGGCDLLCGADVACGHVCKRLCHVQDRDHELHRCTEKCTRYLCNNVTHLCRKLCYEECGPCIYLVPRALECGHTVHIECHIDPAKYKCQIPVSTKLPCDHVTAKPCSIDANKFRCPFPCDTRVEPCGHACDRACHVRVDPDHLKYKCMQPCAKPSTGCRQNPDKHICTKLCFEDCDECNKAMMKIRSCGHAFTVACKMDVEEKNCEKPCKKILTCGHPCKSKCLENCGPCEFMVDKIIPDCRHPIRIKCHQAPERKMCKSKICHRVLPCGHNCTRACKDECTPNCKEIVDCKKRSPCGHNLTRIMCCIKDTSDPETLLKYCTNPCGEILKCKHTCSGTCGECMQSRIHKRCTEKCSVPLVCNHECPIPCREACKPCTRNCEMKCKHSKCKKKCGEPCTPCKNDCSRKCMHVKCTKRCGDICDVPPCIEKCPKLLKCDHPCVGFCGDPCPPLCRECDNDELTDIFFGTEDEEDSTFVFLTDCKHVLEHTGLENWLNQGENEIQFKTCPKCKTNITTTQRYSDYFKRAIQDVSLVKKKSFGESQDNEVLRKQLLDELLELRSSCPLELIQVCQKLLPAFLTLSTRLKPSRNDRRQPINQIELNAIQSKIQTLSYIIKCFSEVKQPVKGTDSSVSLLNVLVDVLLRSEDHITDQEIDDLKMEIKRLHRIIQLDEIEKTVQFRQAQSIVTSVKPLAANIRDVLFGNKKYSDFLDNAIKINLKNLATKVNCMVTISDKEKMDIVKAIGMAKGHWFKCPNGHEYVIGDCGGAMEVARCFCGAAIGVCQKLQPAVATWSTRLMPSRNDRRQTINQIELNAIRSKIQTLSYIIKCFSEVKQPVKGTDSAVSLLNVLVDVLLRSEDHITDQEIDDLKMEIKRLHRIIQLDEIEKTVHFKLAQSITSVKALAANIRYVLFGNKKYSDFLDNAIKINLKNLATKVNCMVNISDKEKMDIVKAIGMKKGHWFKCPNGHEYVIGDCGGAMEVAKCFCGAAIGGTNHHLLQTNQFAGEMDGATRHAYPGGLH